jgi:pimeloyl-ACP methyl ester carboxylesterase
LAKLWRRAALLLLVSGVVVFLLPAEKAPPTGQWLGRAGLVPHLLKVGRFEVNYVRKGQGPSVVLIHGLASSLYSWSEVLGPLSQKFDVTAVDLPGFGASSQPPDLSFAELPGSVIGLMDALGISRAHLVGSSLGGAVAAALAARQADRVDHLVILDSAGFNTRPGERPFMVRVMASPLAGSLASRLPVRRVLTAATLRHLFHDETRVTEERIDEIVAPLLRPGAPEAIRSLLLSRVDDRFVPDLKSIQAKTLVAWGRFDPWLPESQADQFVAAIKGARKVVLPTGHLPQEERPAEVAALIVELLIS